MALTARPVCSPDPAPQPPARELAWVPVPAVPIRFSFWKVAVPKPVPAGPQEGVCVICWKEGFLGGFVFVFFFPWALVCFSELWFCEFGVCIYRVWVRLTRWAPPQPSQAAVQSLSGVQPAAGLGSAPQGGRF